MLTSKSLHILDAADEVVLSGRAYMAKTCWGCGLDFGAAQGVPKFRRDGGRELLVRQDRGFGPRLLLRGVVCRSCAIDIRARVF